MKYTDLVEQCITRAQRQHCIIRNPILKQAGLGDLFKRTPKPEVKPTAKDTKPYDSLEDFNNAGFKSSWLDKPFNRFGNAAPYKVTPDEKNGYIKYTYNRPGEEDKEDPGLFNRVPGVINYAGSALKYVRNKAFSKQQQAAEQAPNVYTYRIYRPEDKGGEVTFNLYPDSLPSATYGKKTLEALRSSGNNPKLKAQDVGSHEVPEGTLPLSVSQLVALQSGDPGFNDRRIKHWLSVPKENWHEANLIPSSPEAMEAWKNSYPRIGEATKNPQYQPLTGAITPFSNSAIKARYKAYEKGAGNSKKPSFSQPGSLTGLYDSSYNPYALSTDVLNHELNHSYNLGTADVELYPSIHLESKTTDGDYSGAPTAMRPEQFKGMFLTPFQKQWVKDHNIDPYAINELEMNQALMDFNAGRYRLRKDMLENPDNPNYAQIDSAIRQQFAELPSFVQPGEEGRKQLDQLIEFYDNNPQFIPMMGEQARLIGYYKNLKAAVENAQDPYEKQFFQGMMDRMLYNKSFLASIQSPRPSYTDVQRMRAYA